ncbi:hypothetical protein CU052_22950 [Vibrio harveyi]|uniref:Uncharacterized protein n=1 Tax=Vibrio harveyi TaxID=669 RepID=A0A8B3DBW7_VIBHA|nr:hypothetical protein CU052_22950 [Vibrio harveyi]RIW02683.1 hypothetical protein DS957_025095 [Vibrio harveyi]
MRKLAVLRGEQRRPPHLSHNTTYTKAESNRKYRALGIHLKRFVMYYPSTALKPCFCAIAPN